MLWLLVLPIEACSTLTILEIEWVAQMAFELSVPGPSAPTNLTAEPGSTLHFIGANGGGKTRLAVLFEDSFRERAHKISAHRALTLSAEIPKVSEKVARLGILTGHAKEDAGLHNRPGSRWRRGCPDRTLAVV